MLTKFVAVVVSPLGTAFLLGIFGLLIVLSARSRMWRGLGGTIGLFALIWLWLWSMPAASDGLCGWLEDQAGDRFIEEIPQAEVMVVLGGGLSGPRPPKRPYPDLNASADRLWHAVRLFRAGKARRIILSGGVVKTGNGSEARAMQRFLLDMGVPAEAMQLETGSTSTSANAVKTAAILKKQGISEVLLVTSALHMPRARKLFEKQGLAVIPGPTDFEVVPMKFALLRVLPNASALQNSAAAMKELLGLTVASL